MSPLTFHAYETHHSGISLLQHTIQSQNLKYFPYYNAIDRFEKHVKNVLLLVRGTVLLGLVKTLQTKKPDEGQCHPATT